MIFIKALNTNFVKEPMTCTVLKYVKILELSCLALAIVANIHAALHDAGMFFTHHKIMDVYLRKVFQF